MRRLVPFLPLVAAIALLLSGALESLRFDASPAAAKEEVVVIEHATTDATVDLGEEGDSVGDTLVFSNEVYDSSDASVTGGDGRIELAGLRAHRRAMANRIGCK